MLKKGLIVVAISPFLVLIIMPLVWMLIGSFKSIRGLIAPASFLPTAFILENYQLLFKVPVLLWTWNSIVVSVGITALCLVFSTSAGYGLEKKDFKGKEVVFWAFLASMMIPGIIALIPQYLLMRWLGLFNNRWALILPGMISPFMVFMYRSYLKSFPDELLLAADMDGAGELRKFFSIVWPLTKPILATIAILVFVGAWKDFLWPTVIMQQDEKKTLTVGLVEYIIEIATANNRFPEDRRGGANYGVMMAATTYSFIPLGALFIFLQRYFVNGIYQGDFR